MKITRTLEEAVVRVRALWLLSTMLTLITCTYIIGRKVEKAITVFKNMQASITATAAKQDADNKKREEDDMKISSRIFNLYVHQIRVDARLVDKGIMTPDGMMQDDPNVTPKIPNYERNR